MGLLDDAIREHLELKRRHGGDPGEIERQEREALGATPEDEAPEPGTEAAPDAAAAPPAEPAAEPLGDETTVMPAAGAEAAVPDAAVPAAAVPDAGSDEIEPPPGEEEVPSAGHEAEAPGYDEDPWLEEDEDRAEPASPPPTEEHPTARPGEEDVLEETPEFLQETPEHDRLWFEQKPPRDFDWDR